MGNARRAPTGFFYSFSPLQHERAVDAEVSAAADGAPNVVPAPSAVSRGDVVGRATNGRGVVV